MRRSLTLREWLLIVAVVGCLLRLAQMFLTAWRYGPRAWEWFC